MNEDKYLPYASLLLRLALAVTLLSAVADRFGFWGDPGDKNVAWGSWLRFVEHMQTLVPFGSRETADKFAMVVTVFQIAFALMLLFGIKIRWAAIGTGMLFFLFAVAMSIAYGIKAPLDASVLVGMAASFLLACIPIYRWTPHGIKKKTVYRPY
ncbi:putative membrane protein YphA (DoxX/SURF4 family) [Pontibacter aydingkolensis]|uniref:DoxX family membrane protein n=1 Tax=Pontibacter aydingkolensis TaxID=1911536 RepID=A0ABS7CY92_9BACT|nr:MauE/DoxX family redox-associated membrane protein [Pontibacter aydingkolensis]MBW7468803.1 DoxX family membrane protein [Pontibacter aydingkolensis]